ncbi:MAG: branched-chain amino acid ABC transporter permease [Rhodobiaceae bacterium]|nr:branched-chain amino acid ABC transporter permease [Rhodobiaceae bacterium]MCC0048561.1 branched-chain amino acid ABC transporter permease [Rhodobiaceae bacterium]
MKRETFITLLLMALLFGAAFHGKTGDEPFIITLATKAAIFAIAGVGLNLALGYGGLVSFGHAAFFGIGGYAAGIIASAARNYAPVMTWPMEIAGSTSMPVIWLAAIVAAMITAIPIGIFSLRTGGVYFIMITLAFAQMLYYFAVSWPAYGGEDGLSFYVRNEALGLNMMDPWTYFAVCFGVLAVVLALMAVLVRSRFGLALEMARQNPQRLTASGIRPFNVRLTAFVISAMITGLAGALYADLNRFVSPSMLSWHTSGEIMVFVILGGVARLGGPVAGACLYLLLEEVLGDVTDYWQVLLGIVLLLVVLFARGGLVGLLAGRRAAHD